MAKGNAKGSAKNGWTRNSLLQISVHFDKETFDEINALATKNGATFSATVRDLVEWGLEDQSPSSLQRTPERHRVHNCRGVDEL